MTTSSLLRAELVSLRYGTQQVLDEVSVDFALPETVAITGPSGSGKTSLLYALSGLERDITGSVTMLGQEVGELSADALSGLRLRQVGFVFQSADLVPELTLRQNIALPLELAGVSRARVAERVRDLETMLGLEDCSGRRPNQVSGGQAQRCAVARAVVAHPRIVFADEPTGALDQRNRDVVLGLLLDQVRQIEGLLITVTHDPDVAARFDRRISLVDGVVEGEPDPPADPDDA